MTLPELKRNPLNQPNRLGMISTAKSQPTGRTSVMMCNECGLRTANSLGLMLCHVCFRLHQIGALPPLDLMREEREVVPQRYCMARLDHLGKGLYEALNKHIDAGVLLWGGSGTGKTYAMTALARKYFYEGYRVRRVHYESLCLQLRDTFKPRGTQTEWGILEPLLAADMLFVEDIGAGKSIGAQETDFSARTFLVLLDMRLEECRPTFITSNKSPENLGFGERIADRLHLFKVFKLGPKSRRQEPEAQA